MVCPKCNYNNESSAKFCVNCGTLLTQEEAPPPSSHCSNQVWNTEIDKEKNRSNRRTAMLALAVVIALVIALISVVWFSLPSIGDSLIGERVNGARFTDRLLDFWDDFSGSFDFVSSPEPAPGIYLEIQGEADEEFLELMEAYLEDDYNLDYTERLTLPAEYIERFEALLTADYADEELLSYSIQIVSALRSMRDSVDSHSGKDSDSYIAEYHLWLAGYTTLCQVTTELSHRYGLLSGESYISAFYADMFPIYKAELTVEQDMMWQLVDAEAQWDRVSNCNILYYTNCTDYELDVTFYNDYETEDDYFYEEQSFTGIMPGDQVKIELREMPEEYENWYIDWVIDEYYIDGTSIYDYYW